MSEQDLNNFDNQLKSKLESMNFDPPASLKNKLSADFDSISANRRRRRFLIWFATGLSTILILSIGFGSYYYLNNDESGLNPSDSLAMAITSAQSSEITASYFQNQSKTNKTDTQIEVEKQDSPLKESASFTPISPIAKSIKNNNTNRSSVVQIKELDIANSDRNVLAKNIGQNVLNKSLIDTDLVNTLNDSTLRAGESLGSDDMADINSSNVSAIGDHTASISGKVSGVTRSAFMNRLQAGTFRKSVAHMPLLENPKTSPALLADQQRETTYKAFPLLSMKGQNCLRPFVTVGAGTGLSYRFLKSDAHTDLVAHKNQNEHSALSYSAQVAASIPLFKSYAIKGGFQYLRLGEAYHFAATNAEHQTVNTYDYMNLDLKLTKNLFCDGTFRVDLSAGAKMGMLLSAQSSWLDPNDHSPILHSSDDQQNPFSQYMLSWNTELAGYYTFGNNWLVGLALEGDYFQNSVYIKQTGLVQRPYFFQGSLVFGKAF
jgi:hypothetical protein